MTPQEALDKFEKDSIAAYEGWDKHEQLFFANAFDAFNYHMYSSDFEYNSIADIKSQIRRFEEAAMKATESIRVPRETLAKAQYIILEKSLNQPLVDQITSAKNAVQDYLETNTTEKHQAVAAKLNNLLDMISKLNQSRLNLPDALTVQFKYKSQEDKDPDIREIFDELYKLSLNAISRNRSEKVNLQIMNAHSQAFEQQPEEPNQQIGYTETLRKLSEYKGSDITAYVNVLGRDIQNNIGLPVGLDADSIEHHSNGKMEALKNFVSAYKEVNIKKEADSEATM